MFLLISSVNFDVTGTSLPDAAEIQICICFNSEAYIVAYYQEPTK